MNQPFEDYDNEWYGRERDRSRGHYQGCMDPYCPIHVPNHVELRAVGDRVKAEMAEERRIAEMGIAA